MDAALHGRNARPPCRKSQDACRRSAPSAGNVRQQPPFELLDRKFRQISMNFAMNFLRQGRRKREAHFTQRSGRSGDDQALERRKMLRLFDPCEHRGQELHFGPPSLRLMRRHAASGASMGAGGALVRAFSEGDWIGPRERASLNRLQLRPMSAAFAGGAIDPRGAAIRHQDPAKRLSHIALLSLAAPLGCGDIRPDMVWKFLRAISARWFISSA
jgi:hypothetical protein